MSNLVWILDAYRHFARRHPIRFIAINIVLVILWVGVIMRFSGENADISGPRSAKVLVGIVNAVAPSANVTLENYEEVAALHNSERVIRKLAHMIEYGFLTVLVFAVFFGFRDMPRKYSYILPVLFVMGLGMIDEKNQTTVSGRYGSWFDVCVDTAAAIIVVILIRLLTIRYRRRKIRENKNLSVRNAS